MRPTVQSRRSLQFRLRTLFVAAAIGPVLLALLWYVGLWLWFALPDLLQPYPISLTWLVVLTGPVLAAVSVIWPPRSDEKERASRPAVLVVAGVFFVGLWAIFWPSFGLLGWLLIWGDNQSHWESNWVWLWSLIAAAILAANVAIRGIMGTATRRYAFTVALLALFALLLVAPFYLRMWLR